jgi:hypothetical protein
MLSDFDKAHVQEILWNRGNKYDWFSAQLIRLINHSDPQNVEKLRTVYPEHVAAVEAFHRG